jgi:hypothetical protein
MSKIMSSQAYTPGLKRKTATIVQQTRRLPISGDVLVKKGDNVEAETIVARTFIPGNVHVVNVVGLLAIDACETSRYMLKKEGEKVKENEPLAMIKSFFSLSKRYAYSPVEGFVERISDVTGQVLIRENPVPLEIDAYIPGRVVEVLPNEGAVIETPATFIQGIFGVGGEKMGQLMTVASHDELLTAEKIKPECKAKILVGGTLVTGDAIKRATEIGVKGIITGGINDEDLTNFLGYKIGVAITGHEDIPLTIIITEGFGKMNMSKKTFALLNQFEGRQSSINGATQIRAGVIRPEIIIPRPELKTTKLAEYKEKKEFLEQGLVKGTTIRIIREPYFGALGTILRLPVPLQRIETESDVRVLEAELEDGRRVTVPRANVEIIEE